MKQKQRIKLVAYTLVIFWLLIVDPAWAQSSASVKAPILDTNQNVQQLPTVKTEKNGETIFSARTPKIETKCGEPKVTKTFAVTLEQGYTYVVHKMIYALIEPSDKPSINGCKHRWVPERNTVILECWCHAHDRCEEEEPGKWKGPKSEVEALIFIQSTKAAGR